MATENKQLQEKNKEIFKKLILSSNEKRINKMIMNGFEPDFESIVENTNSRNIDFVLKFVDKYEVNKDRLFVEVAKMGNNLLTNRMMEIMPKIDIDAKDEAGNTAMSYVAGNGDSAVALKLYINGANPECLNNDGDSPLRIAAKANRNELVRFFVKIGASLETKNQSGNTVMLDIIKNVDLETLKYVVESQEKMVNSVNSDFSSLLNEKNKDGCNAMPYLAVKNDYDKAAFLLNNGAEPNTQGKYIEPAICEAAKNGNSKMIALLLNNGANINDANPNFGLTPIMNATLAKNYKTVVELATMGANLNTKTSLGSSLLSLVLHNDNILLSDYLIKMGADILLDKNCLVDAAKRDNIPVVDYILNKGVEPSFQNEFGYSALHWASRNGNLQLAQKLINFTTQENQKANIDAQMGFHRITPLIRAVESSQYNMVKFLCSKGANVNLSDYDKKTPLMIAAKNRDTAIVRLLLKYGAQKDLKNAEGRTASEIAKISGSNSIATMLGSAEKSGCFGSCFSSHHVSDKLENIRKVTMLTENTVIHNHNKNKSDKDKVMNTKGSKGLV